MPILVGIHGLLHLVVSPVLLVVRYVGTLVTALILLLHIAAIPVGATAPIARCGSFAVAACAVVALRARVRGNLRICVEGVEVELAVRRNRRYVVLDRCHM